VGSVGRTIVLKDANIGVRAGGGGFVGVGRIVFRSVIPSLKFIGPLIGNTQPPAHTLLDKPHLLPGLDPTRIKRPRVFIARNFPQGKRVFRVWQHCVSTRLHINRKTRICAGWQIAFPYAWGGGRGFGGGAGGGVGGPLGLIYNNPRRKGLRTEAVQRLNTSRTLKDIRSRVIHNND